MPFSDSDPQDAVSSECYRIKISVYPESYEKYRAPRQTTPSCNSSSLKGYEVNYLSRDLRNAESARVPT